MTKKQTELQDIVETIKMKLSWSHNADKDNRWTKKKPAKTSNKGGKLVGIRLFAAISTISKKNDRYV